MNYSNLDIVCVEKNYYEFLEEKALNYCVAVQAIEEFMNKELDRLANSMPDIVWLY